MVLSIFIKVSTENHLKYMNKMHRPQLIWTIVTMVFLMACQSNRANLQLDTNDIEVPEGVEVIKFDQLEEYLNATDDRLYVINFWATWCAPCVKELPYFEKINSTYSSDSVQVVLVSLDFKKDLEQKLNNFVLSQKINSKVVLLDETKYNEWIDKVSPEWSGAIPATLFHHGPKGIHDFYEQEFKEEELNLILKENLLK